MKVLITGAAGFLGSHICQYFLQQKVSVYALGRLWSSSEMLMRFRGLCGILEVDLPSPRLAEVLAEITPDMIVHCASSASVPLSMGDPLSDLRQSVGIFSEVLDAVRLYSPNSTVALLSSAAVYGQPKQLPTSELERENPVSPYGYHKWLSELLAREYSEIFGVKTLVLRIFSAYGERLYKQVVYDILKRISTPGDNPILLFGTGQETRDFIHAQDISRALFTLLIQGKIGTYNIASGNPASIATVASLLSKFAPHSHPIIFNGISRPGDPDCWHANISKLTETGFVPSITLENGLEMVASQHLSRGYY